MVFWWRAHEGFVTVLRKRQLQVSDARNSGGRENVLSGLVKRAGLVLLLLPTPLMAAGLKWEVGVGGDAYWFDWREYDGDEQLLVESGPMMLGRGDLRLQAGDFYSRFSLALGGGKAHYDGQLQDGTPYQSDAWEGIVETELQLGWQQSWGSLYAGLMQRDWDRQIEGSSTVSSVHEIYRWRLIVTGGEVNLVQTPSWNMALALDYGRAFDSWQKVHSDFFGDFNLEPGEGHFWRVSVPVRHGAWEFTPFVQGQTMEVSQGVQRYPLSGGPLYTIVQPESERIEGGLRMRYIFGNTRRPVAP